MKKLSVKRQLTLAFSLLAVIVLLVSLLALHGLSQANDRFKDYVDGAANRESLAVDLRGSANRRAIGVRDMVLVKTDADRAVAKNMAVEAHEKLQIGLKALKSAVASGTDATERDRELVAAIDKVEAQYGPVAVAIVQLAASGMNDQAIDKMNIECRPLLAALLAATKDYINYNREQARAGVAADESAYATQRALLLTVSALSVLIALALGWQITRRLLASLGAEPADLS